MDNNGSITTAAIAGYSVTLAELQGEMACLLEETLIDATEDPGAFEDHTPDAQKIGRNLLKLVERIENDMAEHAERWRLDRLSKDAPEATVKPTGETRGYAIEGMRGGKGTFSVVPPAGFGPDSYGSVKTFTGSTAYERASDLAKKMTAAFRLGLKVGRAEARPLLDGKTFPNIG